MLNNISYASKYLGSYRIILELASNTASHVYLGKSAAPDKRNVAIKQFHTITLASQQDKESFFNTIYALQQLNHPHILPIISADIDNGMPYTVSPYAPNSSLRDRLQREAPISQDEALTLLFQIGQALHYTHQKNVTHGNLKPQNILFDEQGMALLTDFRLPFFSNIRTNSFDDLAYVAPELSMGTTSSKEGDQYALGSIAYEMFTGRKPFTTPSINQPGIYYKTKTLISPTKLNPALPTFIERAILTAMAKKPAQRYRSILEFLVALGVPPILTVPDGLIFPNSGDNALSLSTQQKSGKKSILSLPKKTPARSTAFAQFSLAGETVTPNTPRPLAVLPLRSLLTTKRNGLRRFLPLLVTILVLVIATGGIAFAFSFNQMQQRNNALTVAPFQIVHPTAAPQPPPTTAPTAPTTNGGGITVPAQPTVAPPKQPKGTTPPPAPIISPTTTFSVTPNTLNATNCTPSNGVFTCTVKLALSNQAASSQKWYAYGIGVSAYFTPSSGTVAPGHSIGITLTVFNTCTTPGTFVFVGPKTNQSVIWKC